jgi:tRNA pseudouridine38-40 synthase
VIDPAEPIALSSNTAQRIAPEIRATHRIALGVAYRGQAYHGWQSQADGCTVQDVLEKALTAFADTPITTVCAGRTDSGVHALNQVVHLDTPVTRDVASWVRGTNRYLPHDVAVQWCQPVAQGFHARNSARARRYRFVVLESTVRPSLDVGLVGWVFRPLNADAMRQAAAHLIGQHDFTSFRAADCQSPTPIKDLRCIDIIQRGAYWRFDFEANAFLQHMVRNLMGCLLAVGSGRHPADWAAQLLAARDRKIAPPTFPPAGLYFVGPQYDAAWSIPTHTAVMDWVP